MENFRNRACLLVVGCPVPEAEVVARAAGEPRPAFRQARRASRDTLGDAAGAADQRPDRIAHSLLDAARAAFSTGVPIASALGAAIVLTMAITAMTLLRHVPRGQEPGPDRGSADEGPVAAAQAS